MRGRSNRKKLVFLMGVALSIVALASAISTIALAGPGVEAGSAANKDNRPDPLTTKQLSMRRAALQAKLGGKNYGKVARLPGGRYVQLAREGEGQVWTVLGEFADLKHNTIPQPDRSKNNMTMWVKDFNRGYFMDLLFSGKPGANSLRNYYIEQSSNRYAVTGDVTDWVTVPGNAATYDDSLRWPDVWQFLADEVNVWYQKQKDVGKTDAQINAYLGRFDKWDRYDYDGDGNFDEPDGYIDTFQSVHAGVGQESGAPLWTIRSHCGYAYADDKGTTGPGFNKSGGLQIGNSGYWVGKYTIEPENGGVGVFAHEFGHALGLPDLYDTMWGDNGAGFWTVMSSGSWLGNSRNTIGNMPSHMGAWEKLQLGWLNYQVAAPGATTSLKLGPLEFTTKQAQGILVNLPAKVITTNVGTPYAGAGFYYSGSGDNFSERMYKSFNLVGGSTLSAKVKYDIEPDFDYADVIVSTDSGVTWQTVHANLSNSAKEANGIDGLSDGWVDLAADLTAYTGEVLVGFAYATDETATYAGFMADDITITGHATDGAESDAGWTYWKQSTQTTGGFRATTGTEITSYSNYYLLEYRNYLGYDSTLKVGPQYNGYLNNPDLWSYVDRFPYQDGLLISYWDTSQVDNDTSLHPGSGLVLPIDAHYTALKDVNGAVWANSVQTYDSTFGLERTDAVPNIHVNSVLSPIPSLPAVKVFDDRTVYWDAANPRGSVKNPQTGTVIKVISVSGPGGFMQLQIKAPKQ